jgi:uncharacterized protein (DUF1778 family)
MNDNDVRRRNERLYVRLTAEEAEKVAFLADKRGLSVSDFVRKTVLRGAGLRTLTGRRSLPIEAAATIRQLSAIADELRRLLALAETNKTIPADEVRACLSRVQAAIAGVAA